MIENSNSVTPTPGKMKAMGILLLILGILAIAMPWVAGESVVLLIGFLVIAGGIARLIWAFQAGSLGRGILVFLIGILTLLAGIAILSHPVLTSAVLTIVLAVYFLVDGVSELFAAFGLPTTQKGKGWLIFDGVITLLLGVLIFTGFPLSGTLAIGIFLGIKLLLAGMTIFTMGAAAKAAA